MNIEVHLIQNFAPSCLNRDDTNTPKNCLFGGVRRARVSSQCLKRTIRLHMRDQHQIPTGTRTRRLAAEIARLLPSRDPKDAEVRALVALEACEFSRTANDAQNRTSVGLYLATEEISALAVAVDADWNGLVLPETTDSEEDSAKSKNQGTKKTKKAKEATVEAPSVEAALKAIQGKVKAADIALFGRMIAERPRMKVNAACQVAHALSTHEVEPEMDYFTAVDDLQPEAEPGAGMLGIAEYNSACLYRYALINRDQLIRNLEGNTALADRAICAFVASSIDAIPSARQNSSAAQNPPDYVQVVVGAPKPVSLVNAFVTPVRARAGLVDGSISTVVEYEKKLQQMYGPPPGSRKVASTASGVGDSTVPELLDWLDSSLGGR